MFILLCLQVLAALLAGRGRVALQKGSVELCLQVVAALLAGRGRFALQKDSVELCLQVVAPLLAVESTSTAPAYSSICQAHASIS
jgi:hypothetical protein